MRVALATNFASLPAGNFDRSAVNDWIASPSGSEAVMFTVRVFDSSMVTRAGATTIGARSPEGALTTTRALAEFVRPPLSVTVTRAVQVPAAYVCGAVGPGCGPAPVPSPKSNV